MPKSKKRHRDHKKTLKQLRLAIAADMDRVESELGVRVAPSLKRRIQQDVFTCSNSSLDGFFEAPLPSHRGDLRRDFIRRRLNGEGKGERLMVLAAEYEPTPNENEELGGRYVVGHPQGPTYDRTMEAFKSQKRRAEKARH